MPSSPQKAKSYDKAAEDDLKLAGFAFFFKKIKKTSKCSHDPFQKDKFRE